MSIIHNTIGSLTTLKSRLIQNNIDDFKSLKEVIDFQNSYEISKQQLITHHKNLLEEEKYSLDVELISLDKEIIEKRQHTEQLLNLEIDELKQKIDILKSIKTTNIFGRIHSTLGNWYYQRKIKQKENNFDDEVQTSINHLIENYQEKSSRYQFISSNLDAALQQSAHQSLSKLERKKGVVDSLNSFIYGALGEQKVVKSIESLPDEYILINDFSVSFSPAIYNRQGNDYIKSVQIDHVLIAPSGIFLIETKNWSEKSLENLSLRSPVQQIRRTSFALFKLLNNEIGNYHLHLNEHHWGDKKIPIKNLIVMTNTKPQEEFQYVKILTLSELLGYINYFKPIFSIDETQRIADFILRINDRKVIVTK